MSSPLSASGTELIRLAHQGEPDAVERLLPAYRNYLLLLARTWVHRVLPPMMDQSDVVQDTLLKAHEKFADFRGTTEPELAGWLRRILARNILDAVRRFNTAARQVGREKSLEQLLGQYDQSVGGLLAASGTSPSQAAERRELGVVLADALAGLSDDHREVIILRSLQGCDWNEVAAKMNRSPDAVRMLWTRALKQLRPHLQDGS